MKHDSQLEINAQLANDGIFSLLKASFRRQFNGGKLSGVYTGTLKNLATVLSIVNQHWLTGGIVIMFAFIIGGLAYPIPLVLRYFIDKIILPHNHTHFWDVLILLLGLYAIQLVITIMLNHCAQLFEQRTIFDLRKSLTRKVFGFPASFFNRYREGYITSRMNDDIIHASWFFSHDATNLMIDFIKMTGAIFFLFYIDYWTGVVSSIFLLCFLLLTKRLFRQQYILSLNREEQTALQSEASDEGIANIHFIKSSTGEYEGIKKIVRCLYAIYRINLESLSLKSFTIIIGEGIPYLGHFLLLVFGSWKCLHGDANWTLGTLLATQIYLWYLFTPIKTLSRNSILIQNAKAALQRVASIFDIHSESNLTGGQSIHKLRGQIIFDCVAFQYQGNPQLLKKVSFKIAAGEKVAIVGLSGSGRTTLTSLMLGLYRPQRGQIYFDGIPVEILNLRELRKCLGYIPSEPCIINGSTLLEIIQYFSPRAKAEKIETTLEKVGLKKFTTLLPKGMNTKIGKSNATLSPSIRQRLILAGYILNKPDVLITDNITDSLDSHTEKRIMHAIRTEFCDKTVLMISNRHSSVMRADKVLLLHQGMIANFDTPARLAEKSAIFSRILDIEPS